LQAVENVQELFQSARDKQAAGDVDGAIGLYEEIISREPRHAGALHALGILMNRRADFRRAAALLEQAVALRPSDPAFHVELAEGYRNLGAYRDAIGCCLTGLRLRPEYPEAWNTLGLAIRGAGDIEGALERFLQAISCREDFFAAHVNAGQALMELGRVDRAIPHFRRAVELAPDSCQARTSLGLALSDRGQNEEALPHLEEAARLGPDLGVAHHNVGHCLRLLGRTLEARASYLRAIRIDPGATLSYLHVGMTLRLEGALHDALRWYKLAVEMEPDNPHLWEELADLHQKRDEPDEAVGCRQRVLDLSPADPLGARIELGWALQEDGRLDEALEQYRIALDSRPNSARVHLALGRAHEELGDMAEAEARAREAIRLQPRFPAASAHLAALLGGRCPDDDLRVIEALLSDAGLGQEPRAHLLFALAHVLDARQQFPEAASCLREANALTLETRRAEGVIYHPGDHDQFVEGLIRAFDRDFFRRVAGLGLETTRPVFVVGLPRSGTTLVEQILASHGGIYGAGERLFGRRMFEKLPSVTGRREAPMDCVAHLDEYPLKLLAGEHLGKLNALDAGRHQRIVDKLPDNYLYIGLLAAMFPNATFIHCRRDLRDVAVSCWMSDFRGVRWANDPMHIGARFRLYRRLMGHWSRAFPAPVIEIDYEDTVSDLEGVARRLIEGCRLEWDPSCLDFHQTRRVVRTASLTQVRQPIYKSSVARWKNYENELADLFAMLRDSDDDDHVRTACERID
jgi:tetratricopeptide (TPR) repeat protein